MVWWGGGAGIKKTQMEGRGGVWGQKSAKYSKVSEIFQNGFCMVFKANCSETMFPMILEAFLKGTPRQKNRKWGTPYPKWRWMRKFLVPWRGFCFVFLHFCDFRKKSKKGSLLPLYYILLSIPLCAGFPFVFLCFLILEYFEIFQNGVTLTFVL